MSMRITESQLRKIVREEILREDAVNVVLDVAGLIPGLGEAADVTNALLYASKGEYLMSALSLVSLIPAVGDAIGKGGKVAVWATKSFPRASAQAVKWGPKIKKTRDLLKKNETVISSILDEAEKNEKFKAHVPKMREALSAFAKEDSTASGSTTEGRSSTRTMSMTTQGNTRDLLGGAYGNPQPHRQSVTNDLAGHTVQLSEGLQYHLSTGTLLDENVYRPGTPEFFALFNEARRLYRAGVYEATDTEAELLESDIGRWGVFEGTRVPLDFPMWDESDIIPEAKYQGREVTLGVKGAKRSGGRAHVYVRDPKSGKVKKISFGSGMPDAMGDSEAHRKRRKSFGDRHDCAGKKDKMKAGYWACRATKMFGRNIPGWW